MNGSGDKWPAVAEIVSLSRYGAAGTDGFGTSLVTDRFHKGKHDQFLNKQFVEGYWKPFLQDGNVLPGKGKQGADLCRFFKVLRVLLSKTFLLIYLILAVCLYWLLSTRAVCEKSNIAFAEFVNRMDVAWTSNNKSDFINRYEGKCVDWVCVLADVRTNSYVVRPAKDTKSQITARIYFRNPAIAFDRSMPVGSKIRVAAQIQSINDLGVMLKDAEYRDGSE